MIIGNVPSERQENTVVNEGTSDRDFTVGTSNDSSIVNGNVMNVKTLERCFNERIDKEMNNIVDTVEDRIQNAILTAIDHLVAPKIELASRSINASSGRDVTSVSANSERREQVGINAPFESASGSNDTLGVSKVNDETRHNIADEVSELSVPEPHFDRIPPTHHRYHLSWAEIHDVVDFYRIRTQLFFNFSLASLQFCYLMETFDRLLIHNDEKQVTQFESTKILFQPE